MVTPYALFISLYFFRKPSASPEELLNKSRHAPAARVSLEFARVEKCAVTDRAGFELQARLPLRRHLDHLRVARRALDLLRRRGARVLGRCAGVQRRGRPLDVLELLVLPSVEPEALAPDAPVDLDPLH